MNSFVAIDFETAQPARHTPCAIGMVKVVNGVITQKVFTLIRPPDNVYAFHNVNVHGINSEHSEDAPEFPEVYQVIKRMLNNNHVVCHNASFDLDVLRKSMEYHGIDSNDLSYTQSDTLELYGRKSLDVCCKVCGIDLHHHDALSDAEACARLFLRYHNCECKDYIPGVNKSYQQLYQDHGKISGDILKPDLETVKNHSNPFFNKKVVITGVYNTWPDRKDLALIIKNLGADIDSGVTTKTQILIAGESSGPKKIDQMQKNIALDNTRQILSEGEVVTLLNDLK